MLCTKLQGQKCLPQACQGDLTKLEHEIQTQDPAEVSFHHTSLNNALPRFKNPSKHPNVSAGNSLKNHQGLPACKAGQEGLPGIHWYQHLGWGLTFKLGLCSLAGRTALGSSALQPGHKVCQSLGAGNPCKTGSLCSVLPLWLAFFQLHQPESFSKWSYCLFL